MSKNGVLVCWIAVLLFGACCQKEKQAAVEKPQVQKSIGSASMEQDGTIVLMLRAEDPETGAIGDGLFKYPVDHPKYQEVLKHLGGLKPGDKKPVPPWPDKKK